MRVFTIRDFAPGPWRWGEALGIYRDYPTSPDCTSPFAPTWINEMVRRQPATR
jgi:hypothetical protein